MTFLPLVQRELRVRARRRATYWQRFAVALAAVLVCLPPLAGSASPIATGKFLFQGLVISAFVLCCMACLLTADNISAERREGTLPLLLLTRVRVFDLLLGKLSVVGITAFCALLAFLPVLILPVLAGGVSGAEALRKGFVLLNTLFLAIAAGLHGSSSHERFSRAARNGALLLAAILFIPQGFWTLAHPPLRFVGLASPLVSFHCAQATVYATGWARAYWMSLIIEQALGWLLLAHAALRLRHAASEKWEPRDRPMSEQRWHDDELATPVLKINGPFFIAGAMSPVEWLVRRQRGVAAALWAAAVFSVVFNGGMPFFYSSVWRALRSSWASVAQLPSFAGSVVSGTLIAWAASRFFIETRRSGELELLMTTPLGRETIVADQWKALRQLLLYPILVMLLPHLPSLAYLGGPRPGFPSPSLYSLFFILGIANTVLSVVAISRLALLFAFKARSQAGAVTRAVAVDKGIPFLISLFNSLVFTRVALAFGRRPTYSVVYVIAPLLITIFLLWIMLWAKRRLAEAIAGIETQKTTLQQLIADTFKSASKTVQRARHWSPTIR